MHLSFYGHMTHSTDPAYIRITKFILQKTSREKILLWFPFTWSSADSTVEQAIYTWLTAKIGQSGHFIGIISADLSRWKERSKMVRLKRLRSSYTFIERNFIRGWKFSRKLIIFHIFWFGTIFHILVKCWNFLWTKKYRDRNECIS